MADLLALLAILAASLANLVGPAARTAAEGLVVPVHMELPSWAKLVRMVAPSVLP